VVLEIMQKGKYINKFKEKKKREKKMEMKKYNCTFLK